jgi:hypothetical protein
MARYNEILVGRYNRFLQKLLTLKGGPPAPQLASEINAGFVLFNGSENRSLESWQRFGGHQNQAAVAAQQTNLKIRNPLGSNLVVVIEKMLLQESAGDTAVLSVGADVTNYPTVLAATQTARLDPRGPTLASGMVLSAGTNGAQAGINMAVIPLIANTGFDFIITDIQELTLLPGDSYNIQTTSVNVQLRWSLVWRERLLEESERT